MFVRFLSVLALLLAMGAAFGQLQKEPYKLGPEDVITVSVHFHPEWSSDLLLPVDGVVDLPIAGPTKLAGMSLAEVKDLLFKTLSKRIVDPEVTVTLRLARARRIYVEGAIKLPMALDYKPGWRISECLAGTGGLIDNVQAIDCKVILLHSATGKVDEVSLPDVQSGLPSANLPVEPGDVVTVKNLETMPVYVVGEVKSPGVIRMRLDQMSLMSAIAMAGGLNPTASTAGVTVTHANGQIQKIDLSRVVLYGEKKELPTLQSGDLVSVPVLQSRFAMTGLVQHPGVFPLEDGKIYRLSDGIALAGGNDTHRARMSRVAILRNVNGKMTRMIVDYGHFLDKGDGAKNPILQPGDVIYVPETNSIDWNIIFQGLIGAYYIVNTAQIYR